MLDSHLAVVTTHRYTIVRWKVSHRLRPYRQVHLYIFIWNITNYIRNHICVSIVTETPEKDRSLSEFGSNFTVSPAAGTPLLSLPELISGEKQHNSQFARKDLFNQFDSMDDSISDLSFVDLSSSSTPEKLGISTPAQQITNLEEIIIISSEGK